MKFCDKVRGCRKAAKLTQEELAGKLGLSKRTIEGYESGKSYPRSRDVYAKLAELFDVDVNYFLAEDEAGELNPREQAQRLIENAKALYAGGALNEEDKDALARALMDAYFIAKAKQEQKKGGA